MGFLDSFKQSFEEESEKILNRQAYSKYRTVTQIEEDKEKHRNDIDSLSDGALLDRANGIIFVSMGDKAIIEEILKKRGYKKSPDGKFHRKKF